MITGTRLDNAEQNRWHELYRQLLILLPKGIRACQGKIPFFTGYSYGELYDWDQYFEGITLFYAGFPADYTRNGIRIFLSRQEPSGFIARSVPEHGGPTYHKHMNQVKPFLAQEALLCHHAQQSLVWLTDDIYDRLRKYIAYWFVDRDLRGAGLSVWNDAEHTGMDNHYERAGEWGKSEPFCEGVDLNCYLVREATAMSLLARLLNRHDDAATFAEMARQRRDNIQKYLWNEKDGIFYDYDLRQMRQIPVKYVGAFATLWAGVATKDQAARLVREHLLNDKEFWRPWPLPALAANDPGYVEGHLDGHKTTCCSFRAHTWMPTNYFTIHGLRAYGFLQEAEMLAEKTWKLFSRAPFCEYYTSESGIGTGLKPFWGWSCLALFVLLEIELNVDPTQLTADNHSIKRMQEKLASML